jgi:TonB family protein
VAQLMGGGFELGQTLSGSGAGKGDQGTVRLSLTIDRGGHVVSARVTGSSGSSTLDQAALEMARRASGRPLPPEMGSSVNLTVPIRRPEGSSFARNPIQEADSNTRSMTWVPDWAFCDTDSIANTSAAEAQRQQKNAVDGGH